jgi:hypothetical protein
MPCGSGTDSMIWKSSPAKNIAETGEITLRFRLSDCRIPADQNRPLQISSKSLDRSTWARSIFLRLSDNQYRQTRTPHSSGGGHNILMEWPPWSGKTMLSKALWVLFCLRWTTRKLLKWVKSILLPENSRKNILWSSSTTISLVFIIQLRLFRLLEEAVIPNQERFHWLTKVSSFLDEMLEFPQTVLETLRQPLEDGVI